MQTMLDRNPDATLMAHGHQLAENRAEELLSAMETYDNLYWTIDIANLTAGLVSDATSADDFMARVDDRSSRMMPYYKNYLQELLAVAPNRVVWGTDFIYDWSAEPRVYEKAMSLTEELLEPLTASQRAAYTHENAVGFAEDHFGL
jgi:hypothetical protein